MAPGRDEWRPAAGKRGSSLGDPCGRMWSGIHGVLHESSSDCEEPFSLS